MIPSMTMMIAISKQFVEFRQSPKSFIHNFTSETRYVYFQSKDFWIFSFPQKNNNNELGSKNAIRAFRMLIKKKRLGGQSEQSFFSPCGWVATIKRRFSWKMTLLNSPNAQSCREGCLWMGAGARYQNRFLPVASHKAPFFCNNQSIEDAK